MSATLLINDTWQPTVLQLMPFSSNNASNAPSSLPERIQGFQPRGFPTLAVTRSRSKKDGGKPLRVSSERMPRPTPSFYGGPPQRAKSEYSSRGKTNLVTTERIYSVNNRIITETGDPDDSESSDNVSCIDIPRNTKLLPKPSPCKQSDGRYFMPQNGFWRSVTLTPGEMELQKHREKFGKETGLTKSKKYKLNVNQLPRSTTPINDNDPDKLNIKQVIKFLQTKEVHPQTEPTSKGFDRRVKSGYPSIAPSRDAAKDLASEGTNDGHMPKLTLRREATTGVLCTSKSHNSHFLKKRIQRHKRDIDMVGNSNENTNPRSSFKNTREFRLHRFLTMAPNADEFTQCTQTHPITSAHRRLLITECSRSADVETDSMRNSCSPVPPYLPSRHGERYARLHYRLPNRRPNPTNTTSKQNHIHQNGTDLVKEGIIRLPSMLDFNNDSDNDDNDEWKRHTRAQCFVSPEPSIEVNGRDSSEINGRDSAFSSSDKEVFSDSECSSKAPSRKVTVSLPRESPTEVVETTERSRRPADPVRLSLRQEHVLTREKTYMSDIGRYREETKLPSVVSKSEAKTAVDNASRSS